MQITSPEFQHNQALPAKYTCDGEGKNPPLNFVDVPAETKSLALVVEDPDAPRGTFVHWVLWNIDPKTTAIAEGGAPAGAVEGETTLGKPGFVTPCPPSGSHRYMFKLFALDTMLEMPATSNATDLEQAYSGHIVDTAELVGLYQKQK